jgi:hypothetical protein
MRKLSIWTGLGLLFLALLAINSWGALASPNAGLPGSSSKPAPANLELKTQNSLLSNVPANVPLRDRWWANIPNIDPATKMNLSLLAAWQSNPNAEEGFMVYLKAQADTSNNIADWKAKGEYVLHELETVANATQPDLLSAVNALQAAHSVSKVTQFTILNAVFVHGSQEAARELARRDDVAFIEPDHRYYPLADQLAPAADTTSSSPNTVELGVSRVHAPAVWALGYKGDGVVVGHIDTGVQYNHPALVNKYRGNLGGGNFDHNYNWWDTTSTHQPVPFDDGQHGTHTIGTVLGDDGDPGTNQIGVAPHAKFITARVFPAGGSSGNEEITVAEDFMIAPWNLSHANRRPDLRPNIVTNSWGDNECWNTDSWLITQVWIDDGLMPAFANGNAGPGVGTVGSPGGYPFLLGVGAISASSDTIAGFSSRGPSCYGGALKPDVVAPGVNVRSSIPTNSYASFSGTSMATPHTAGVMALLLSANPSLTYTDVMGILTRTAYFAPGWGTRPNNNYGWGLIQADSAVEMALHGPHVHGTVARSGTPVAGASVSAVRTSDNDRYNVKTWANGTYSMTLLAGTYDVTASAFGYVPQTLSGQAFITDTSPTVNFNLVPQTTYAVSGRLLLTGACTPLSGTVQIDPPGWVINDNPTTGAYTINLPAGTYTFTVRAPAAYQPIVAAVNVSGATTQDFTFGAAHDGSYVVDSPVFNWISGTTSVTFTDPEDGHATLTLPFTLTYYGSPFTTVNMGTNGLVTFSSATQADMWANTSIPTPGPGPAYPNNALYPYWDDLGVAPRYYGAGYSGVSGTAPNRIFVMEWRGVAGTGAPITFEVQLEETTNRISFLYQNLDSPYGYGYSATEGIENAAGTDGIMLGFNQSGSVGNNRAYRFTPGTPPIITPCLPAPTATSTVTPIPGTPTATPTACTITFTDVSPTDYYYVPVTYLYCHGAISGYADNTFRPGNLTTRGQLSKIVVLAEGWVIYTPPTPTFRDVDTTNAFYTHIETAYHQGIISGYNCGTGCLEFRPGNNVTRGQLAKIVVLAQHWEITPPTTPTFRDMAPGDPFYGEVETAYAHNIISGYACGTGCLEYRPGNNATRGQISKIVYLAITGS